MKQYVKVCQLLLIISVSTCGLLVSPAVKAQTDKRMVRLAKIQVDPAQLEQYNTALKEQMEAAIRLEAGVLSYVAVADKKDSSHITILEIYADDAAYRSHIDTDHFRKYKATVQNMVKKLELVDVNMIGSAKKPDQ